MSEMPLERLGRVLGLQPALPDIYSPPRTERRAPARPVPVAPVDLSALLRIDIDLAGGDQYWTRCQIVDRDETRQLLDPPAPFRGHLRILRALDPNPGPDGARHHVLLLVRARDAATCHAAAAATFGIHPAYFRPTREV